MLKSRCRPCHNPGPVDAPICPSSVTRTANGRWRDNRRVLRSTLPGRLQPWLLDGGSLTRRLSRACMVMGGRLCVTVLEECQTLAVREEGVRLGLAASARVWRREVVLSCDDRPLVFARTLIPATQLRGHLGRLARVGNRPLGQLLFRLPAVRREPLELALLPPGSELHRRAMPGLDQALWARRSIFRTPAGPLLVCEVFLPCQRPGSDCACPYCDG